MNKIKSLMTALCAAVLVAATGAPADARIGPPAPPSVSVATDSEQSSSGGCYAADSGCLAALDLMCRSIGEMAIFRSRIEGGVASNCAAAFSREIRDNPPTLDQNCQVGQSCYCSGSTGGRDYTCAVRLIETCVAMGARAVGIGIVPDVLRPGNSVATGRCEAN